MRRSTALAVPALALALAVPVAGCGDDAPPTVPATAAPSTTIAAPATTVVVGGETLARYRNAPYGFELLHPTRWGVREDVEGLAVLFTAPGYPDALSVQVSLDPSDTTWVLADWVSARRDALQASLGASGLQEWLFQEGPTLVGTDDGWLLTYAATLQPSGVSMFYAEVLAVKGGRGFVLTLASPDGPADFPAFGAMVASLESAAGQE